MLTRERVAEEGKGEDYKKGTSMHDDRRKAIYAAAQVGSKCGDVRLPDWVIGTCRLTRRGKQHLRDFVRAWLGIE